MAINKVTKDGQAIIDLSNDTVLSAGDIVSGKVGHLQDGTQATGTAPTGVQRSSSDVTASGQTVTVPAGVYSSQVQKSVASGTAGTPTATKGSVSNHSVTVTPKVTNTTGYITGGTKTGSAVTVSASELVSGSETKTENGTYDVTNLASLVVNVLDTPTQSKTLTLGATSPQTVTPDSGYVLSSVPITLDTNVIKAENFAKDVTILGITGTHEGGSTPVLVTKTITTNGTYNASTDNADGYSQVTVSVSGGGSGVINPGTFYENGVYTPTAGVDGYAPVTVAIPEWNGSLI